MPNLMHTIYASIAVNDFTKDESVDLLSKARKNASLNITSILLYDFFTKGNCLSKIDAGRAKKRLKAFAQSRWRLN